MIKLLDEKGNQYELEFNRKTVTAMENSGFVPDLDKPYTMVDSLFYGAFQMHHPRIDRDKVREIWKGQRNKEKLIVALTRLYQKPLEDLMDEPEGDAEENPTWEEV